MTRAFLHPRVGKKVFRWVVGGPKVIIVSARVLLVGGRVGGRVRCVFDLVMDLL